MFQSINSCCRGVGGVVASSRAGQPVRMPDLPERHVASPCQTKFHRTSASARLFMGYNVLSGTGAVMGVDCPGLAISRLAVLGLLFRHCLRLHCSVCCDVRWSRKGAQPHAWAWC